MKIILLIILLCGVTSTPNHTVNAKKVCKSPQKTASNIDIIPSGLLFEL